MKTGCDGLRTGQRQFLNAQSVPPEHPNAIAALPVRTAKNLQNVRTSSFLNSSLARRSISAVLENKSVAQLGGNSTDLEQLAAHAIFPFLTPADFGVDTIYQHQILRGLDYLRKSPADFPGWCDHFSAEVSKDYVNTCARAASRVIRHLVLSIFKVIGEPFHNPRHNATFVKLLYALWSPSAIHAGNPAHGGLQNPQFDLTNPLACFLWQPNNYDNQVIPNAFIRDFIHWAIIPLGKLRVLTQSITRHRVITVQDNINNGTDLINFRDGNMSQWENLIIQASDQSTPGKAIAFCGLTGHICLEFQALMTPQDLQVTHENLQILEGVLEPLQQDHDDLHAVPNEMPGGKVVQYFPTPTQSKARYVRLNFFTLFPNVVARLTATPQTPAHLRQRHRQQTARGIPITNWPKFPVPLLRHNNGALVTARDRPDLQEQWLNRLFRFGTGAQIRDWSHVSKGASQ